MLRGVCDLSGGSSPNPTGFSVCCQPGCLAAVSPGQEVGYPPAPPDSLVVTAQCEAVPIVPEEQGDEAHFLGNCR